MTLDAAVSTGTERPARISLVPPDEVDAPYWRERRWRAMGSDAHLQVGDAPAGLVDWAVQEVERLEGHWSRFRPDSELCRLNATAGRPVEVSTTLLEAVVRAQRLWEATGGLFDPTILDDLERAGYDRSFESIGTGANVPARSDDADGRPPARRGMSAVWVDEGSSVVWLPDRTRIDLGGLGKGLAADLVAEGLVDRGARSALVSLGGDIRVAGEAPDGGWCIPVEDPLDEGRTWTELRLTGGAVVTSTTRFRRWVRDGVEQHHLIDPATGRPSETGVVAAVARSEEAWWAEGVAKAAVVAGADRLRALTRRTGVDVTLFGPAGPLAA